MFRPCWLFTPLMYGIRPSVLNMRFPRSGNSNNVDGYMSRLRKKVDGEHSQKLIYTIKGLGWTIREAKEEGETT